MPTSTAAPGNVVAAYWPAAVPSAVPIVMSSTDTPIAPKSVMSVPVTWITTMPLAIAAWTSGPTVAAALVVTIATAFFEMKPSRHETSLALSVPASQISAL